MSHKEILLQRAGNGGKFKAKPKEWTKQMMDRHANADLYAEQQAEYEAEKAKEKADRKARELAARAAGRTVRPSEKARERMK